MDTNFSINHQAESTASLLARFDEARLFCFQAVGTDDFRQSENAVCVFVDFLDSLCETALADLDDSISKQNAFEILSAIHRLVSSASNQILVDAISLELPRVVAKFAGVSDDCREVAQSIIDHLCSICSPRDMLPILCGALDFLIKVYNAPNFFIPLLSGISKVFVFIRRHHYEQIKSAVPVIVHVLKVVSSEPSDEDNDSLRDLLHRVIGIASSIQAVCKEMVGGGREPLMALLGLCVLQVMALISRASLIDKLPSSIIFVVQLSEFLPFCGYSYLGLVTGHDVDKSIAMVLGGKFTTQPKILHVPRAVLLHLICQVGEYFLSPPFQSDAEDDDHFMNCFSLVKYGAYLAVIWGHISDEVAMTSQEEIGTVKDKLRTCQTERWQAMCMLRYLLSSPYYPWELKSVGIDFLLSISDGDVYRDERTDWSPYMPGLFSLMEAVELVIVYASDAVLRKKAFAALKRVLADIPSCQRLGMLKDLVSKCSYPSMIALLVDLAKEEIAMRNCQKFSQGNDEVMQIENKIIPSSPVSSTDALDLVGLVLKPPKGGPPVLPEYSDAVVSALNLYRFLLMVESAGKTNHTGVLLRSNLQKAYNEWFLPLRALVSGIRAENENDYSEFAVNTVCSLNPVQVVLQHCIELVEHNLLKHSAKSSC